ncbi:sensor histidine kinase [Paractinoplanes durhamensis]|uniref:Anti-sigma regulatory factor (Ser/Thr protein kinase) n=1 Tax=Paractinoplanes durhamensis TaxID=113563 RepID=A0ABQ3YUA3_9ACTN|nr:sensor histidine kinase [Actinoplanes durhamensis]GIE01152.1 hypothetical protein Adu01nite_25020 [Actinoplanes durhamensis]
MRTGAAAGHTGYFHEALCFSSDAELIAAAVPFLVDGAAAGEPAVVSLGERDAELIRAALPAGAEVDFVAGGAVYARPATAIRSYRKRLADYVAGGASQIRIVGAVPADFATWDWWGRYESAINRAYDDFPLWSMCVYDTRTTAAPVLADVLRTHPRRALPDGRHVSSATYTDPVRFLSEARNPVPDPLQGAEPLADLVDPALSDARRVVRAADRGHLADQDLDDLVVAVSEVVANAQRHGRGPVRLRLWSGAGRIVVTVTDAGAGPADPFVGLLPSGDGADGGLGLWIVHQSCSHVALHRHADGFTVRLTAGALHH